MKERRQWKRYEVAYPIERDDEGDNPLAVQDISRGGISFVSCNDIEDNEKVSLQIFLKKKMFNVRALVVYTERNSEQNIVVGAKFLNPSEEFLELLNKEIEAIVTFRRESSRQTHKTISFNEAADKFLKQ